MTVSELVLTQGHDKSADYWAYGVLLYELICGFTPFESSNQQRTFEKIVHSQKHLSFPPDFDPHVKSLIRRLLHPNSALRIGTLQSGSQEVKTHASFMLQSVDFTAMMQQEMVMPYIPPAFQINSEERTDITPFDIEFECSVEVDDSYDRYFLDLNDDNMPVE